MDRTNKFLALAFGFSIIAVACSSPAVEQGADEANQNASSDKPKSTKDSGSSAPTTAGDSGSTSPDPTEDDDGGTSTPTTDCGSTASYDDCFSCCDAPSGGELAAANDVFGQCACDADCKSQCGSNYCNGQDPSAACETCLTNTCEPKADATCTSSACQAAQQCMTASSCDSKP